MFRIYLGMALLCLAVSCALSRDLTLLVEPTYSSAEIEGYVESINTQLQASIGYEIRVVKPKNYYYYWRDLSRNQTDLVLESPHIAAYRIHQLGYKPVVRKTTPLAFHLAVHKDDYSTFSNADVLKSKRIATLPHPSLPSILFENWYTNSVVQPRKILADQSWHDGIEIIESGKAEATIIPDEFMASHSDFISIKKSDDFLGLSLLSSPTLAPDLVRQIKEALLAPNHTNPDQAILYEEAQLTDYLDYLSMIPQKYLEVAGLAH
ncbi:PhnD/SsuA/transferrin family substrate-binding protein [Marinicella sp. W31]|uniref:PhnD/SsuA/transferrin family substrate-binding protein n=1 Tax=Marinicella sp. W31 TaxID=3023713 RepID=UPI003757ADF5